MPTSSGILVVRLMTTSHTLKDSRKPSRMHPNCTSPIIVYLGSSDAMHRNMESVLSCFKNSQTLMAILYINLSRSPPSVSLNQLLIGIPTRGKRMPYTLLLIVLAITYEVRVSCLKRTIETFAGLNHRKLPSCVAGVHSFSPIRFSSAIFPDGRIR